MLTGLRKATETWLGRIVLSGALGLIIVSFAIWGIGNIFHGFGQTDAATVGHMKVSSSSFRRAYQAQLERLQAETRTPVTDAQARAMGLDRDVLSALVADAAMSEKARALGLAIGADQLNKLVLQDPAFKNPYGAFDPHRLVQQLSEQGYTQNDLPLVYMRRQIAAALVSGTRTPRTVLEVFNRFKGEQRTLQYAVLPASSVGDLPKPTQAELQKFYEAHRESYRAPEYRNILVLALTPAAMAKPDQVSDADARKLYDQVADGRFGEAERRTVQQLTFPTEADAKAALGKIKAGADFKDIAKERRLAEGSVDLGTKSKAQLGEIADAAFALPPGGVSDPVKIASGYALVRVTQITPSSLKPFAEVSAQLKAQIATSRVRQADLDDLHDKIEALRSSGKPLREAASAVSLAPREIAAIDASGRDKSGAAVPDLSDRSTLLKAVFASDVGLDNDTLQLASGGYEWFEIRKVEPAHDRSFAEVKAEVEKQWRSGELAKRLSGKSADIVRKINEGAQLASLLPGADVKSVDGLVRGEKTKVPAKLVSEAFSTPVGRGGAVQSDGDSRLVFKVTAATPPPFDPNDAEMQRAAAGYGSALTAEIVRQYAVKLEDEYGLRVNHGVLRAAAGGAETMPAPIDQD